MFIETAFLIDLPQPADEVREENLPGQPFLSRTAESLPWDPGAPASQPASGRAPSNPPIRALAVHASRNRMLPEQAAADEDQDQDVLLPGPATRRPAGQRVQGPNARQSQPFESDSRPTPSNLLPKGRGPSTLRAPQGSPPKAAMVSKQLKVCCALSYWQQLRPVCHRTCVQGAAVGDFMVCLCARCTFLLSCWQGICRCQVINTLLQGCLQNQAVTLPVYFGSIYLQDQQSKLSQ